MSINPRHRRLPRARVDPIDRPQIALQLLVGALHQPPEPETLVVVLDDARCGLGVISVSGTSEPHQVLSVVECLARPGLLGGEAGALIVASSRPGGDVDETDLDRWLEMCDLAEAAGLELVEWFVIGRVITCPRDLLGAPPRWRDVGARQG